MLMACYEKQWLITSLFSHISTPTSRSPETWAVLQLVVLHWYIILFRSYHRIFRN